MYTTQVKKFWTAKYNRVFQTVVVDEKDFTIMEAILSTILNGNVKIIKYLLPSMNVDTT